MDNILEKRAIRTVRRKKLQDLLAVLFFLLLLPYTCANFVPVPAGGSGRAAAAGNGNSYVLVEQKNGIQRMPLEEFLVGALAASIPAEYCEETLKAQAVILRSSCLAGMQAKDALQEAGMQAEDASQEAGMQAGNASQEAAMQEGQEAVTQESLDLEMRQAMWGEKFPEMEEKLQAAVRDTAGIVLTFQGKIISPSYFRLSAGHTRNGTEIFGEENGGWYRFVECPHDLEEDRFLQEKRIKRQEFSKRLAVEGMLLPKKGAKLILLRDSAGYVLSLQCNEYAMEGEKFRKLFDLPSSCFYLKEEKGDIILQTKGIGHGLGFSQYSADLLAADGMDYLELLNYFFKGLTAEKTE